MSSQDSILDLSIAKKSLSPALVQPYTQQVVAAVSSWISVFPVHIKIAKNKTKLNKKQKNPKPSKKSKNQNQQLIGLVSVILP